MVLSMPETCIVASSGLPFPGAPPSPNSRPDAPRSRTNPLQSPQNTFRLMQGIVRAHNDPESQDP